MSLVKNQIPGLENVEPTVIEKYVNFKTLVSLPDEERKPTLHKKTFKIHRICFKKQLQHSKNVTSFKPNLIVDCRAQANFANNGARSEHKIGQNDRSSHSSLAPHAPLWKHFTFDFIPEKLIFTPALLDDARKITLTRSSNSDSNQ